MSGITSAAIAAGVVSLTCTPATYIALRHFRVHAMPTPRSAHVEPTPLGSGISVLLAVVAGLVAGAPRATELLVVVGAIVALASLGAAGDYLRTSVEPRLFGQLAIGAASLVAISNDRGYAVTLAVTAVFAGAVWICAMTNAFNFMDGIDGISIAQAAVAGTTLFLVGAMQDDELIRIGGACLAISMVGLLPFNIPRARVFLGDVGSYAIGGTIATLTVIGVVRGVHPVALVAPVAVCLADTGWALSKRIRAGLDWRAPHTGFGYQRLVRAGIPHWSVAGIVAGVSALNAGFGLLAYRSAVMTIVAAAAISLLCLAYLCLAPLAERASVGRRREVDITEFAIQTAGGFVDHAPVTATVIRNPAT
jgi:UDP-GlcNAc:undecaprenyl-phosphate/decaprenyl-phosphate GlcNAc-1-phosphate transferase